MPAEICLTLNQLERGGVEESLNVKIIPAEICLTLNQLERAGGAEEFKC